MTRLVTCLVLAAFAPTAAPGAQTPAPQEPRPVFRAGVELATVLVSVVDRNGRPVPDLAAEDFVVRLDGQVRPVRAVDYREHTAGRANVAGAGVQPGGVTSGAASRTEGRVILLVFDDLSYRTVSADLLTLRQAAEEMLHRLAPGDLVGIATTSGMGPLVNPTSDRRVLVPALHRIMGQANETGRDVWVSALEAMEIEKEQIVFRPPAPPGPTTRQVMDRECPPNNIDPGMCATVVTMTARVTIAEAGHRTTLQTRVVFDLVKALAQARGVRILLFMSAGLAVGGPIASYSELSQFGRAAAEAGVQVYGVTGGSDDLGLDDRIPARLSSRVRETSFLRNGVDDLMGAAGAPLFRMAGSASQPFDRILLETSGVYQLGIDAPPEGRRRLPEVVVSVRRPGLTVRANRRALVPSLPPEPVTIDDEINRILGQGLTAFGVPLAVASSSRRDPSGRGLQLGVNIAVPMSARVPVKVSYAVVNDVDRVMDAGTGTIREPAAGDEAHRLQFAVTLPPGRYRVRVAAADADDRLGGVEHGVELRLQRLGRFFAGDLQTSWIDQAGTSRFLALPQVPASAVAVGAGLELYAAEPDAAGGRTVVRLDLVPVGQRDPVATVTFEPTAVDDRRQFSARVPVAALDPGQYTLTATVLEGETPVGSVVTTFEKTGARTAEAAAAPLPAGEPPVNTAPPARPALPRRAEVLSALGEDVRARTRPFDSRPLLARPVALAGLAEIAGSARETVPAQLAAAGLTEEAFQQRLDTVADGGTGAVAAAARGLRSLRLNDVPAAGRAFEQALVRAPASVSLVLYLGATHAAAGRDADAAGAWQLAVGDPAVGPEWRLAFADALRRLGDLPGALEALREVGGAAAPVPEIERRVVETQLLLGRFADARTGLARLVERSPEDDEARFWQVVLAFADAVDPDRLPDALDVFRRLAAAYLERGGSRADLVRQWLAAVS